MATSTCTYHDKYWEFLQERHAVWLKTGQRIFPVGRGRLIKNKVLPVCT